MFLKLQDYRNRNRKKRRQKKVDIIDEVTTDLSNHVVRYYMKLTTMSSSKLRGDKPI